MATELLVTGGGGLLGNSVKALCPNATFVTSQDYDLRDGRQVQAMFQDIRPVKVLHLAARIGGVKLNEEQNADLFTENVLINTNVLSEAAKFGVSQLISILASCAFPIFPDRASTETDLHVNVPFAGNLGYGYSKRMLEIQTRLLVQQYGVKFIAVAPVTMYGPHDNFDLENGHVIGALIHKCFLAKKMGESLQVWGTGKAERQFVFVEDIARLAIKLLNSADNMVGPLIVAPYSGITIESLVNLIATKMDYRGNVKFDSSKPEGGLIRRLDSIRFRSLVKDFIFTPIELGLDKTINWFLSNSAIS